MTREKAAIGALVAGAAGIAFAPIFVRWALPAGVGPTAAAFWRLALAAPVLWVGAWAGGERPCLRRRRQV